MSILNKKLMMGGTPVTADVLFATGSDTYPQVTSTDIRDPNTMSLYELFIPSSSGGGYDIGDCRSLSVMTSQKMLYAPSYTTGRIASVNFEYPKNMEIVDVLIDSRLLNSTGIDIDEANEIVYVCTDPGNVISYDISDPENIAYINHVYNVRLVGATSITLDLTNSFAYVGTAGTYEGVVSIDISTPSALAVEGYLDNIGLSWVSDVEVDSVNEVLYAVEFGNLISIDVSVPGTMVVLDTYDDANAVGCSHVQLDVANDTAYLNGRNQSNVHSCDITDPSAITFRDYVLDSTNLRLTSSMVIDLTASVLYVYSDPLTGGEALSAIDISDPDNLAILETDTELTAYKGNKGLAIYKE